MSNDLSSAKKTLGNYRACETAAAETDPTAELKVNVIFTNPKGTLAALSTAETLAHDLRGRISLLAFRHVPLPFPLARPPVSVAFLEQRLLAIARAGAQGRLRAAIHLYLCRDKRQAIRRALEPQSLVVVGGSGRWWHGEERALAKMLRSEGFRVVFVRVK
jgi:hypothetical protein